MGERFFFESVDENLVVIDLHDWEFAAFNGSAAYAWLSLLDNPMPERDLVAAMAAAFGVDPEQVKAEVAPLLGDWTRRGWLARVSDAISIASEAPRPAIARYESLSPSRFQAATAGSTVGWSGRLDFLGTAVGVTIHVHARPMHPDFLPRASAFLSGVPEASGKVEESIDCHVMDDAIYLRRGDQCVATRDVVSALSRLVLWCFYLAYGRSGLLATLHAAAVGRPDGMVIMPGVSGAGKSTLTAYLAARGWSYGGDDIVGLALERDDDGVGMARVLPFPSAISVKAGSVPLLAPFYPGLADLPEVRYDLKKARFLGMPRASLVAAGRRERTPRAMVFPRYAQSAQTSLTELSATDALTELVSSGIRTGEVLEAPALAELFGFFRAIPKYRLVYSSLPEAETCLEKLVQP